MDESELPFHIWLQLLIDRKGITQSEVVERSKRYGLRVSQSTISRMLSGKFPPSREFCLAMAHSLNISEREILDRAGIVENNGLIEDEYANRLTALGSLLNKENLDDLFSYADYLLWLQNKANMGGVNATPPRPKS